MKTLSTVVAACVVATALISAQGRPDLSGTWLPDPSKAPEGGGATGGGMVAVARAGAGSGTGGGGATATSGGGGGMVRMSGGGGAGGAVETVVTQSATSLTIERIMGPVTQTYVHTFDGAENLNVNGQITMKTRSRWEGNSLVTEGTTSIATDAGERTTTLKEVRSLDADGALVVETERIGDGSRRASRQFYKRK